MKKKVFRERYYGTEVKEEKKEKKPAKRGRKSVKSDKQYITSRMFSYTAFLLVIN